MGNSNSLDLPELVHSHVGFTIFHIRSDIRKRLPDSLILLCMGLLGFYAFLVRRLSEK